MIGVMTLYAWVVGSSILFEVQARPNPDVSHVSISAQRTTQPHLIFWKVADMEADGIHGKGEWKDVPAGTYEVIAQLFTVDEDGQRLVYYVAAGKVEVLE